MNFFRAIEEKVKHVKQNYSVRDIEDHFKVAYEVCRTHQISQETSAVWYLMFDAIYCFIKHRHWSHNFVFKELFLEFMIYDHKLSAEASEELYQALHAKLSDFAKQDFDPSTQDSKIAERFFRYIFVQAFASEKEEDLIRELGFGYKLLNRIKSVVSSALDKKSLNKSSVQRMKSADQLFEKVFKKLSRSLSKNAMIMDLLRLQYVLVNPMTTTSRNDHRVTKSVFNWLLRYANKRYVNYARARLSLARRCSKLGCEDSLDLVVDRIIKTLEHQNIIYTMDGSNASQKPGLLVLGDAGQQIIGKAFARKFWAKKRSVADLMQLRPILMKICIEEVPSSQEMFVRELFFFHLKEIPSICLKPCIQKLKTLCDPDLVNQQMQSMGIGNISI